MWTLKKQSEYSFGVCTIQLYLQLQDAIKMAKVFECCSGYHVPQFALKIRGTDCYT